MPINYAQEQLDKQARQDTATKQFLRSNVARKDFVAAVDAESDQESLRMVHRRLWSENQVRVKFLALAVATLVLALIFIVIRAAANPAPNDAVLWISAGVVAGITSGLVVLCLALNRRTERRRTNIRTRLAALAAAEPDLAVNDPVVADRVADRLKKNNESLVITPDEMKVLQDRAAQYNTARRTGADTLLDRRAAEKILGNRLYEALFEYRRDLSRPHLSFPTTTKKA